MCGTHSSPTLPRMRPSRTKKEGIFCLFEGSEVLLPRDRGPSWEIASRGTSPSSELVTTFFEGEGEQSDFLSSLLPLAGLNRA